MMTLLSYRRAGLRYHTFYVVSTLATVHRATNIVPALFDMQQSQPRDSDQRTTWSEGSVTLTYSDIMRLFRGSGSASITERDDDDDDDDDYMLRGYGSTPWHEQWFAPHKEPQDEGVELLLSGEFGCVSNQFETRKRHRNISRVLLDRSSRKNGIQREELISVSASQPEE